MDILIKNGTVINANGRCEADVAVKDGKIAQVEQRVGESGITPEARTEIVDASGLLVLPGAIDVHTHFELPVGSTKSADDFFTGTRAAACGGVTMVIDFVSPVKNKSLLDALKSRRNPADSKVCVDYGLHMCIPELTDSVEKEMADVVAAGVPSFKVFTTYAFKIADNEFKRTLAHAKDINAMVMVHAEDHDELEALRAEFLAAGKTDAWYHYLSRPESVETKGVIKAVEFAKCSGSALYIVHLACAGGLEAVEKARLEGYPVYAETCPQYLNFTSDVYKRPDGRNFVCSPPIKGKESREALWQGVINGSISTIATDHCPFLMSEKEWGKDDFTKIPNGVMGVENSFPYMLSQANKGNLPFERVVELCCFNPAQLFGCTPKKGTIATGADADIVIYDPTKAFTISQNNMHSSVDYTIWEDVELKGYPTRTYSRGSLVYKDGEFTGKMGHGRFIKRG
jgi:dihydropyrimidinase